ncbi:MAG: glycerol-3-phosphate 1-O-acyltransferase PlsY [Gemmatimonadota bacterium]
MTAPLLAVAAYLTGAFPTSFVVGRAFHGIDLRAHGSGNLGATNAYRVLGWRAAVPIFLVDIFKGWLPVFWFPMLDGSPAPEWALLYGTGAIVGHVYSAYVGFKGGKGVATGAGVFLALAPVAVLVGLAVWAGLVFTTRMVSLGSIAAAATLPLVVFLTEGTGPVFYLAAALAAFVIWAHRANIRRLVRGDELRFVRRVGTTARAENAESASSNDGAPVHTPEDR